MTNLRKFNLNIINYTSKTWKTGKYDFPYIKSIDSYTPDYLVLYEERKKYNSTKYTTICFFQYDDEIDGINGLYNAIYYNKKNLLEKFKKRFRNCKYFIAPDYTLCNDIDMEENRYRIYKERIVSLWLILEIKGIVIPLITYVNKDTFNLMIEGMEDCEVICFSTKGILRSKEKIDLLQEAIKYTVENLKKLKKIIVYDVSTDDSRILRLFDYAIARKIEVVIPPNTLKERNLKFKKEGNTDGKTK